MKKRFLLLCLGIICAGIISIYFVFIYQRQPIEGGYIEEVIQKMNSGYPMNVVLFGDDLPIPEELNCLHVGRISRDVITTDSDNYRRTVLIVNNMSGNARLSEEEIGIIESVWQENKLDVFSFGANANLQLFETVIFTEKRPDNYGEYGLINVMKNGQNTSIIGMLPLSDLQEFKPEALKNCIYQVVMNIIGDCIDSNN